MKITSKELTDIFQKHVENLFPNKELKPVEITIATNENFGDYQCNFAMINSKVIGDNPRKIAEKIKNNFPYGNVVEKLEVAGPGFINIFLSDKYISDSIKKIGEDYDFSFLTRFLSERHHFIIEISERGLVQIINILHFQVHDEVDDMLNKMRANDDVQEQHRPKDYDLDMDQPDFRSQTPEPEETTFNR